MVAGLLTEIKAEKRRPRKNRIKEIIAALDANDRKEFIAALDDHSIAGIAIVRVMQRRGFKLTETMVSNHRRGVYVAE